MNTEGEHQGEVYSKFINDLLDKEYEQRKTIEGRGAAIVTTSTSLLAIIVGISVLFNGKDYKFASHAAIHVLITSLALFILAGLLGVWVQNAQLADDAIGEESLTTKN